MPTWNREPDPWTLAVLASVGSAVEQRRRQLGWSIRSLAYRVGVAPSTILRLERGEMASSLLLVVRIARAMGGLTIGAPAKTPPCDWPRARIAARRSEVLDRARPTVASTGNTTASGPPGAGGLPARSAPARRSPR